MTTMSNNESYKIRWQVEDPQSRQVVLKQITYESHVIEDHSDKDAVFRKNVEGQVKNVIVNPDFIVAEEPRNLYYKLVSIGAEEYIKLKIMKVVVDADKEPNEIVTWIPMSKVKEKLKAEAIIYERGKEDLSDKKI